MAFEVTLPRLGWSMETGKLAAWLKQDGDAVQAGDVLCTVEGDKAVQEVEALESGILRIPPDSPPPGAEVAVGTRLAYILEPGEPMPGTGAGATGTPAAAAPRAEPATPEPDRGAVSGPTQPARRGRPAISPRARRVAGELGVDWTGLTGTGRTGRIVERDVRAAVPAGGRVSPLARRMASQLGVDVATLTGAVGGRRVSRADVEAAARGAPAAAPATSGRQPGTLTPLSAVRRLIAERMAHSAHTVAPVTLTTEADATELVHLRDQLKSEPERSVPSYTDFLVKLTARALQEHPALYSRLTDDHIEQPPTIDIGIAVDSPRGLLVPVLRDVPGRPLRELATAAAALIEAARSGRISADDLAGGTFTITNLGMYEIDAFTPIINLPECAILGVGRIVPKQVVVDAAAGRLAIRHMMFLSLTFDHRLVDGAPAARFLQRVKQLVEKPALWLVD
jgi:pyruvate dehydrogenase E2 component (dihydrolipoamide acetyltransferase)